MRGIGTKQYAFLKNNLQWREDVLSLFIQDTADKGVPQSGGLLKYSKIDVYVSYVRPMHTYSTDYTNVNSCSCSI